MKTGEYTINEYNFRQLLGYVLNPYVVIPALNAPKGNHTVQESLTYNFSDLPREDAMEILAVNAFGRPMEFPLELQIEGGDWWRLPFEPLISITGKNVIVKKQVSKGTIRGTIKERWCQGDYSINISGLFIGSDGRYPQADVMKLRRHCEATKLKVRCPLFEIFSINQITVEGFEFPATTGTANQGYKITAVSDDMYKLLLKQEDLKKI